MTKLLKNAKVEVSAVAEVPVKKGWRIKSYFVDTTKFNETVTDLSKAPNQVQIMMRYFAQNYNTAESAAQGKVMCSAAIEHGGLKTVIEPAVLFAYYRSTMEKFGLTLRA